MSADAPKPEPALTRRSARLARQVDAAASVPMTRRRARELAAAQAETTEVVSTQATDASAVPSEAVGPESPIVPEPAANAPAAGGSTVPEPTDAFAHAARLFSFTGETAVVDASDSDEASAADVDDTAADQPSGDAAEHGEHSARAARKRSGRGRRPQARRRRTKTGTSAKPGKLPHRHPLGRVAAASLSISAVAAVGLLAVGLTTPLGVISADAQTGTAPGGHGSATTTSASADDEIQAYVSPAEGTPTAHLDRDSTFTTASLVEMAGTVGISNVSDKYYTNDPTCDVQYPFAVGVPISFGFGPRPGEFHEGVDFTPGMGAHVQAIADGTVRIATESGGGYGVTVVIDHEIDGQHWASRYGHMQYGSLQVHPGERVRVGQYLGRTGDTGFSFGAHTHLEVLKNGTTPIDPMPWLREHTC